MTGEALRQQINIELESMMIIVAELQSLYADVADREPTLREKTAAAGFLAQFYNGVENILKRISLYHDVPLPTGENWHVNLFKNFTIDGPDQLPNLFTEQTASLMAPYRRFRHVAFHSYGFQFNWRYMAEGVGQIGSVFNQFKESLHQYLMTLV